MCSLCASAMGPSCKIASSRTWRSHELPAARKPWCAQTWASSPGEGVARTSSAPGPACPPPCQLLGRRCVQPAHRRPARLPSLGRPGDLRAGLRSFLLQSSARKKNQSACPACQIVRCGIRLRVRRAHSVRFSGVILEVYRAWV